MKYLKTLGLLAVAASALMAVAGTASATITSPAGTPYSGEFVATSLGAQIDGTVDVACTGSEIKWATPLFPYEAGSTTVNVTSLTFTTCSRSITTTANGHMFVASNGEVKSTGARITVQTTILGFPVHCIYATNGTKVGTLTEGWPALHIGSATLPQEKTSSLCGDDAVWTGNYTVTKPATTVYVD